MLETLGMTGEAAAIDAAVLQAVRDNEVTQDVGGRWGRERRGMRLSDGSSSRVD